MVHQSWEIAMTQTLFTLTAPRSILDPTRSASRSRASGLSTRSCYSSRSSSNSSWYILEISCPGAKTNPARIRNHWQQRLARRCVATSAIMGKRRPPLKKHSDKARICAQTTHIRVRLLDIYAQSVFVWCLSLLKCPSFLQIMLYCFY